MDPESAARHSNSHSFSIEFLWGSKLLWRARESPSGIHHRRIAALCLIHRRLLCCIDSLLQWHCANSTHCSFDRCDTNNIRERQMSSTTGACEERSSGGTATGKLPIRFGLTLLEQDCGTLALDHGSCCLPWCLEIFLARPSAFFAVSAK
jgi:hypothetical protein